MARPPVWRHTLDEARRQALVAIDFYNRPGDRRSFSDFIVHIHLAWQNLLHADRMRRKAEIFYRESSGQRRFKRNRDGSKKTWDLSQCLKHEFNDNDPVRANIEFFVGLRNHVEHRFQDSILVVTAPQAHACIINFESELVRRFGSHETLGSEMKFPVFVQSLSPSRYKEQRNLRRDLPTTVSNFITEFQVSLSDEVRSDERFAYRLLLLPMKGPKTDADLALNFVRQEDLSEEELQALLGQEGSVIIAEKYREAIHVDEMLPKAAAMAVEARIDFKFSVNDFTKLRKIWQIGPAKSGAMKQLPESDGYCVYSPAFKQFVYRPKLVDRIVNAVDTAEKYQALLGHPPTLKSDDRS
ncbi:hypothetical protein HMPREF1531_00120 [Propionibacterium sp. oral taxon 192 str. F0372]|uniref:DUF3644 domain-containing protein n=1 Tax=Propionibacterium sp. oral taxon 192 TaxID=671222 RepID=UPI000353DCFA|nr:DUF3644 domain-containing protein [Propionibacterium sp. oral taxon 192]EPH07071.1 hypothetical protein HMPREF1531_00120 [Propionibacterium sp. oral taxon 192 str. F0372]